MTVRPGSAERIYRGVLGLYPAEFRHRFGEEMVQLFHDKLRDARSGGAPGGAVVAWMALLGDAVVTAGREHLRRNRTVAHSVSTAPSPITRALGFAGILAGLAILAAYVVELPSGLTLARLVVFTLGIPLIAFGVHRRQSMHAPALSLAATGGLFAAIAVYLGSVLVLPDNVPALWAGVALWLTSAAFGGAAAFIGAVSRMGGAAVAIGSVLALTGIGELGLVSGASPTIFNTLSQVGIVAMAVGWIILGLDLAMRSAPARTTG